MQHQPDTSSQIHSLRKVKDEVTNEEHDPHNQVDINNMMLEGHQQKISQIEKRFSEISEISETSEKISQIEERFSETSEKISQIEERLSEKITQMIDDKLAHGGRYRGITTINHNANQINQLQINLKKQNHTLQKIEKRLTKCEETGKGKRQI